MKQILPRSQRLHSALFLPFDVVSPRGAIHTEMTTTRVVSMFHVVVVVVFVGGASPVGMLKEQ